SPRRAGIGNAAPPLRSRLVSGHRDCGCRGYRRPRHSRRGRRICGQFFRIWQSGHPRSRIANVQLVWRSPRHGCEKRRTSPARTRGRGHWPYSRWGARIVFRASRRRSARGPATMVEDQTIGPFMSSRTRFIVMTISALVIAFAIVGGFLGKVMAREDTYPQLKIFGDVIDLISSNYVEEANIDKVMRGAMKGLADGLDPDSAYLTS